MQEIAVKCASNHKQLLFKMVVIFNIVSAAGNNTPEENRLMDMAESIMDNKCTRSGFSVLHPTDILRTLYLNNC